MIYNFIREFYSRIPGVIVVIFYFANYVCRTENHIDQYAIVTKTLRSLEDRIDEFRNGNVHYEDDQLK